MNEKQLRLLLDYLEKLIAYNTDEGCDSGCCRASCPDEDDFIQTWREAR